MKKQLFCGVGLVGMLVFFVGENSWGAITALYSGNGSTEAGGAVGNGTLTWIESGSGDYTQMRATFTPGGNFSEALVIYIDNGSGSGITTTANLWDDASQDRVVISGYNSIVRNRSTLNFAPGFHAQYAVVITMDSNYGGLYQIVEGVGGQHELIAHYPTSNGNSYSRDFYLSSIGLAPGGSFRFESDYVRLNGRMSLESFESIASGSTGGWGGTVTFTSYDVFPIPEATNAALAIFGGLAVATGVLARLRRHFRRPQPAL